MSLAIVNENFDAHVEELKEWLKIPSVSADPAYKDDVQKSAQWVVKFLNKVGSTDVVLHETKGHPIITASLGNDPKKKTVLVYGHYDVQPVDPIDLWTTPPFEPAIRDGKIYARGADDDKGQLFTQLKAVDLLQQSGELPCNVKFLIEGEEEVGSKHLPEFIDTHKEALKCDTVIISDTTVIAPEIPSITAGLRGMSYVQVTLTGPNRDLHSGVYGGVVHNPISALSTIISQLHDEKGRITIPGFYDDVPNYSAEHRAKINAAPFDEEAYKKEIGVKALKGEEGYTPAEQNGIRPCLDVNGIWGGYTGDGAKTVLPSQASAKISMRLLPSQDHKKAAQQLLDYIKFLTPPSMTFEGTLIHSGPGSISDINGPAYLAASNAYEAVYGKTPIPHYEGASIPIVAKFQEVLSNEVILMGHGLNADAIHSPNENFPLEQLRKGIATNMQFHKEFAKK